MNGYLLCFYMYENQKYYGMLLYEWLLEVVKKYYVYGGLVFKIIVGFGCYGQINVVYFFELVGE